MYIDKKKKWQEFMGKDSGRLHINLKSVMSVCDWKNLSQQIFTAS